MLGLKYPLSITGGNLDTTDDYPTLVKQAFYSGLYTKLEERVMRPEYGLPDQEFTVVTNIVDRLQNIKTQLYVALEAYPQVSFELRGAIADDGRMDVVVVYQVPDFEPETISVTL